MWESRRKYRIRKGVIGTVVEVTDKGIYYVRTKDGVRFPVDQEKARAIRMKEEGVSGPIGRPTLFEEGEPVSHKSITLPDRVWDRLKKPYSRDILRLIEGR